MYTACWPEQYPTHIYSIYSARQLKWHAVRKNLQDILYLELYIITSGRYSA